MSRRERLVEKFRTITGERVGRLHNAIIRLEKNADDEAQIAESARELHTLKGEAKLLGFAAVSQLAHKLEELFAKAKEDRFAAQSPALELVLGGLDLVDGLRALAADDENAAQEVQSFVSMADATLARSDLEARLSPSSGGTPPATPQPEPSSGGSHPRIEPRHSPSPPDTQPELDLLAPAASTTVSTAGRTWTSEGEGTGTRSPAAVSATVRVDLQRLDLLAEAADELLLTQGLIRASLLELAKVDSDVDALLRDLRQAVTQVAGSELDGELRGVLTSMRNRQELVQRQLRDGMRVLLERDADSRSKLEAMEGQVRELRLVPLASLFDAYPRSVRSLAKEQAKKVVIETRGAAVEVDQSVLERISGPMLHLIRNSIDHGAEPPEERIAAGKREAMTLRMSAEQVGSYVMITVEDDGRGVDLERVNELARARGLASGEDRLDMRRAVELLMLPGFTTRATVSELSGRGVGLDVVKTKVEALGGTVTIRSQPGEGTQCAVLVPVSVVRAPTLTCDVGGAWYGIPSSSVRGVLLIDDTRVLRGATGSAVRFEGLVVPLRPLSALLGVRARGRQGGEATVLVLEHAAQLLAVEVDDVVEQKPVIHRQLNPLVEACRATNGTALSSNGRLVVLLNLAELFRLARREAGAAAATPAVTDETTVQRILVVDDSDLTRDMLVSIARQTGHEVLEAADGREAMERMQTRAPDLLITDLEMPLMDGFELLAQMRASETLSTIPVVVCSTRGADADKERAADLGADAYVVKARFHEDQLLEVIDRFLGRRQRTGR
ncbi:MAG: response regulator [Polyangiaceae bacterium]